MLQTSAYIALSASFSSTESIKSFSKTLGIDINDTISRTSLISSELIIFLINQLGCKIKKVHKNKRTKKSVLEFITLLMYTCSSLYTTF